MFYIWAVLSLILIFDLIKQQKSYDFLPGKKNWRKKLRIAIDQGTTDKYLIKYLKHFRSVCGGGDCEDSTKNGIK